MSWKTTFISWIFLSWSKCKSFVDFPINNIFLFLRVAEGKSRRIWHLFWRTNQRPLDKKRTFISTYKGTKIKDKSCKCFTLCNAVCLWCAYFLRKTAKYDWFRKRLVNNVGKWCFFHLWFASNFETITFDNK